MSKGITRLGTPITGSNVTAFGRRDVMCGDPNLGMRIMRITTNVQPFALFAKVIWAIRSDLSD